MTGDIEKGRQLVRVEFRTERDVFQGRFGILLWKRTSHFVGDTVVVGPRAAFAHDMLEQMRDAVLIGSFIDFAIPHAHRCRDIFAVGRGDEQPGAICQRRLLPG